MAIYEAVTIGTLYGQQIVNRYHYMTVNPGLQAGGAQDLAIEMRDVVLLAVRSIQTSDTNGITWDTIQVRDLYDPTDFGELTNMALQGTDGAQGESVSPFTAAAFRSPRFRTGRNRANKRFAGVGEERISGNTLADWAGIHDVEDALIEVLIGSVTGLQLRPQLLFLEEFPADSGNYRLFPTETEQRNNRALITFMPVYRLTTQRSRQLGQGQ